MRRIALIATLLGAVGAADAQTLYKCVAGGSTSYQQQPCPRSARTMRTIETTPEPEPTAAQLADQARKAERDRAESVLLSRMAGTDQAQRVSRYRASGYRISNRVSARGSDGCIAARESRDAALGAVGLKRNFDLLRALDDSVNAACGRR